ncbi:MAG: L-seryl-tRNA(Sec) selenium transferase [bacterium]
MSSWYRNLPSIQEIELTLSQAGLTNVKLQRQQIESWLEDLRLNYNQCSSESDLPEWMSSRIGILSQAKKRFTQRKPSQLSPVINATGIVLHTNLGRAPLGEELLAQTILSLSQYSDLELDLASGERGQRMDRIESLLCNLSQAESAIVVNNNAAAVFLMMKALCEGGEVLVSRGELVEIGGSFRIPDILREAGAKLIEVGTTNRTRLSDYQNSLSERTVAVLKVHPSNYSIQGFTEEVSLNELVEWSKKVEIPTLYDWGSGTFYRFQQPELQHVPTVQQEIATEVDMMCFSGDKLLGGPQAGIVLGRKILLEKLRNHPLYRTVRLDKASLCLLEQTLTAYGNMSNVVQKIPTLEFLERTKEEILGYVNALQGSLSSSPEWKLTVHETESMAGGGGIPEVKLPSAALSLHHNKFSASEIHQRLRSSSPAIVGVIRKDNVLLDLRTVMKSQLNSLRESLQSLVSV